MASLFQNDAPRGRTASWWSGTDSPNAVAIEPGGLPLRFGPFLTLRIEHRGFLLLFLTVLFYVISAFVGNEWCYLLPSGIFAVVLIGIFLPCIEVLTIDVGFSVVCSPLTPQVPEIRVTIKRKAIFKLLSFIIPSGYLNARLLLKRRSWQNLNTAPQIVPIPGMIESLNHGFDGRMNVPTLTRGVYVLENVEISSCFPFAVAWLSRLAHASVQDTRRDITVYPKVIQIYGAFHSKLSESDNATGRHKHSWIRPNQSVNLRGLREFTERDSLTHIHWASSAKSGKLLVREFEVESIAEFDVVLDLTANWSEPQFELAVTTAYSLVRYGQRHGFLPNLHLLPGAESEALADLLSDCPGGLAGEELAAEVLARLAPLPPELRKKVIDDAEVAARCVVADSLNTRRCLLAILPDRSRRGGNAVAFVELARSVNGATDNGAPLISVARQLVVFESEIELARI